MRAQVAFAADDLALARFAVSPMWQTVSAFRLLARAGARLRTAGGSTTCAPPSGATGLDRGWLAELVPAHGYLADLLTPYPVWRPRRRARGGPRHRSRARAARARHAGGRARTPGPRRIAALRRDPVATLPLVTDEIAAFWDLAIAPHWPRIRAVLDADVLHRARPGRGARDRARARRPARDRDLGRRLAAPRRTALRDHPRRHRRGSAAPSQRVRLGRGPDPRGPARAAAAVLPGARLGHDLRRRGRGDGPRRWPGCSGARAPRSCCRSTSRHPPPVSPTGSACPARACPSTSPRCVTRVSSARTGRGARCCTSGPLRPTRSWEPRSTSPASGGTAGGRRRQRTKKAPTGVSAGQGHFSSLSQRVSGGGLEPPRPFGH